MAHYAVINDENEIIEVIVGKNEEDTLPSDFSSWEEYYTSIKGNTTKRTSYNTNKNVHNLGGTPFRGNYASVGGTYDPTNDIFLPPKPYESWVLDLPNAFWKAPIDTPDDLEYYWDEEAYQLDNTDGWKLYPAPPE